MKISLPLHLRRAANIKALADEKAAQEGMSLAEFAKLVGSPRPHISALISGDKSCGNRLAAKIEERMGKAPGWLDADHGPPQAQPVIAEGPSEAEVLKALSTLRMQLDRAKATESVLAGEALRLLALTPDSERAYSNAADILLFKRDGTTTSVEVKTPAQPSEQGASAQELRMLAMRLAEAHPNVQSRALLTDFLGKLDTLMRDQVQATENAPETRHGNNSPISVPR